MCYLKVPYFGVCVCLPESFPQCHFFPPELLADLSVCLSRQGLELHQCCCSCLGGRGSRNIPRPHDLWVPLVSGMLRLPELDPVSHRRRKALVFLRMLHFKGSAQKSLCARVSGFSITGASVHHVCQLSSSCHCAQGGLNFPKVRQGCRDAVSAGGGGGGALGPHSSCSLSTGSPCLGHEFPSCMKPRCICLQ